MKAVLLESYPCSGHRRKQRGGSRAPGYLALGLSFLLSTGIATALLSDGATAAGLRPGDDLLVVDCLLPGQMRKLGRMSTFMTARRAIKTAARDCEIRGGEYVAYDRASYATALKIWLPLAESGDVEAQVNVGEIYEKGLGLPPDHAVAASWYGKAAEQGSSRGAINLASLYEQGLGVNKDPIQALNWYRRASGIQDAVIMDSGTLNETREAVASMRAQVARSRDETDSLKAELDQTRRERDEALRKLEQRERSIRRERSRLNDERKRVEAQLSSARESGDDARVDALERELDSQRNEVSGKDAELASLAAQLRQIEAQAGRARSEADSLKTELAATRFALDEARQTLEQRERSARDERERLEEARESLEARLGEARRRGDGDKVAELKRELDGQRRKLSSKDAELASLGAKLDRVEAEAERQRRELARVTTGKQHDIAALRAEVERSRRESEELRTELARSDAELARMQRELDGASGKLAAQREQAAALRAELDGQRTAANRDEARVSKLEATLAERERAMRRQQADLEKLRAEFERASRESARARATAAAATKQVRRGAPANVPIIEMIDPALLAVRGTVPQVLLRSAVPTRQIVGKVVAPAGVLSLTVNDQSAALNESGLFRAAVPVQGARTPVTVIAVDESGARASLAFELVRDKGQIMAAADGRAKEAPPAPTTVGADLGQYHALIIGNNDYPKLPKLRTAIEDAEAVDRVLRTRYGFRTKLLINATRYEILSALNDLRENLTEKDNLVIYYAGHGELDRANKRGHWLPVDAEPTSSANWISNVAITDILNVMSARQILVVADSCYSGALTRSALGQLRAGLSPEARGRWMRVMAAKRSRTVLTSGGEQPVLDGSGGRHSVFAAAFLEVLGQNSGVLEAGRLFSEVFARVKEVMSRLPFDQAPEYAPLKYAGHEGGDFFFVPKG
jgi:predicted  nucleic acid-binding Zn-ribbon protein